MHARCGWDDRFLFVVFFFTSVVSKQTSGIPMNTPVMDGLKPPAKDGHREKDTKKHC